MSDPPSAAPAPAPVPGDRRRRRILAVAIPVAAVLVLLLGYRVILGVYARHAAAARGIDLDFDHVELTDGGLRVTGAEIGLEGVDGLVAEVDELRLTTRGLDVTRVEAEGVKVGVTGSATDLVLELAAWSAHHADTYRLPGSASPMRIAWRARKADAPWIDIPGGALSADGGKLHFTARAASVGGVPVGAVDASAGVDASGVTVSVGRGQGGEAPIEARVSTSARPPRVDVTLHPVKLETLGASMGLAFPAQDAVASGHAGFVLGTRGGGEAITGDASLLLDGWTPPHPKELNAIVSGRKTTVAAKLAVAADKSRITISDMSVRAGRLALAGGGSVDRAADHAAAKLTLAGAIPCADLVQSAAREDLGGFGQLLGDAAKGMLKGSTTIEVTVEADSRNLRAAKVDPRVGVGCGLKGL
jgi:hypothetical protein